MAAAEERDSYETLRVKAEGAALFAEIIAPPMNLLGPELVRDLVALIRQAEADNVKVLVFRSGDPDYFISHVEEIDDFVRSLARRIARFPAAGQAVVKDRVNAIALAPVEDFRRDSDLCGESARTPEVQTAIGAAMKRGLQTRY